MGTDTLPGGRFATFNGAALSGPVLLHLQRVRFHDRQVCRAVSCWSATVPGRAGRRRTGSTPWR
ncbi:MAG: hypothetical protein IPJ15_10285 [Actinomycetales bacterium]|nr:hypothetical protein [Candidatus Phosphoribacter baldrii]